MSKKIAPGCVCSDSIIISGGVGGISAASTYATRIEQFVAECVVEQRMAARRCIALAVRQFPGAYGGDVAFALTAVAVGLEDPVLTTKQDDYRQQRQDLYRSIALFAADMFAVETITKRRSTCRAILAYWGHNDESFFRD